ncbi:unnamed protein product [Rhizophagus irregularis]|uniref:Uncharacterized protein n=1 Tax=Rhizophagus irregularis TaxID=588596 RepID=A0A2I1HI99_9GLOM|nr:hypothetical protein RhiirA4_480675 [Rhizophagus irregularis]CAB4404381.1 unnamed protein product [Rhizophagus irregularis]
MNVIKKKKEIPSTSYERIKNIPTGECIHCHRKRPVKLGECYECYQKKKNPLASSEPMENIPTGKCVHCHQKKHVKLGECYECYQKKKEIPSASLELMKKNPPAFSELVKKKEGGCIHCHKKKSVRLGECYECYQKRSNRFYSSKKECPECKKRIKEMNGMVNDKICDSCCMKYQRRFENFNNPVTCKTYQ